MRTRILAALAAACIATIAVAQDKKFEITPQLQQQIDAWKTKAAAWASEPAVVQAVLEQNQKGPLAGMDNQKWATLRRRSPEVTAFQQSAAGKLLAKLAAASQGIVSEAFLNAQKGEKVAFVDKTSSYVHAGKAKFDVPFQQGKSWQGAPEFDESSQTYCLQVSVPVVQEVKVEGKTERRTIGVLVVGLDLANLQAATPAPGK